LAAFDWGADFAYPRLAKVVAASDCRLLGLPAAVLDRLVRGSSAVSQLINDAVRRRLPGL
jgi:CRP-like cAMP-binding protein